MSAEEPPPEDREPPDDGRLRYIEKLEYRDHTIKITRRGNELRLLIYPRDALIATQMVTGELSNFQLAVDRARKKVDALIDAARHRVTSGAPDTKPKDD